MMAEPTLEDLRGIGECGWVFSCRVGTFRRYGEGVVVWATQRMRVSLSCRPGPEAG